MHVPVAYMFGVYVTCIFGFLHVCVHVYVYVANTGHMCPVLEWCVCYMSSVYI